MRNTVFILLLVLQAFKIAAQPLLPDSALSAQPTYINLQNAVANADKVYKLDLSKQNLDRVPEDLFKLKVLQVLILSHNEIKVLPKAIGRLKNLQKLDLSKNKLIKLPDSIGNLKHLKTLTLFKNEIDTLPKGMAGLQALQKLDLWENSLYFIPDELKELTALKELDLRGILFNELQQKHIKEIFPGTKIHFSPPCTCNF